MAQQIPGNQEVVVGINDTLTVAGDRTVRIGRNASSSVADNQSVAVKKTLDVVAKNVVVRGQDTLELVCGDASIVMKKDGTIQIRGKDISIEGSGKVNIKSSSDVVIKGQNILRN